MDQRSFRQSDMVTWVPKVENGFALLPDAPGIGEAEDGADGEAPQKPLGAGVAEHPRHGDQEEEGEILGGDKAEADPVPHAILFQCVSH